MGIGEEKKREWLETADRFFAAGDFKAMRACAREILTHDLDDLDALALFSQASLYLGEGEQARRFIPRVLAADPQHWRMLLVAGEEAAAEFELYRGMPYLERLWQMGEARAGEISSVERNILLRAGSLLADAYYLLARPEAAAEMCFSLSALAVGTAQKATFYGKGLFFMNYRAADSHTAARRERYNAFFGAKVTLPHTRPEGIPKRKLRIGYLSPDFRRHAVAHFLTPFLRDYSKLDFNVYCYQRGASDEVTRRFRRFAAVWRDVSELTEKEAARQIFEDKIDILVDFSGHSQGSCLPILALKPAPIQIAAIGDIHTTGLREADYFLSDMTCLPPGKPVRGFTERIALLPYCHLCYAPDIIGELPPAGGEPPAEKNGFVTFGSFNNFAKVSQETLLLWRGVLEAMPEAHFIIKGKIASIPDGRAEAAARLRDIGIDPARVELRPYSPDYLEQYADIDIALDTTPYNGGLTTCEALIMGVPVVSLRGATHASRYGATILEHAGLSELVAENEAEYVKKALRIARSLPILREFHANLRRALQTSRLMDGTAYMKDMEALYRDLWQTYCGGR